MSQAQKKIIAVGRMGAKVALIICVPGQHEEEPEYLLITSTKDPSRWGIVRGTIEQNEHREDTIVTEAWEEAGVRLKRRDLHLLAHSTDSDGNPVVVYHASVPRASVKAKYPELGERKRVLTDLAGAENHVRMHTANAWLPPLMAKVAILVADEKNFALHPIAPPKKRKSP